MTEDEVIEKAEQIETEMNKFYYQLEGIQTIIDDIGELEAAKERLERYQFDEYYPLAPFIFFYKV